ncbi:hypothetical protein NMG90_06810 [Bacillus mycoides]|uniref:hypothetical protein n=1 Tax=Bacillus mycoides TaxID=1405 RepID=UPI0020C98114|nr:hypothetical protein [Bacillus mycoides]MCP9225188.1 hypothetical protein [Bacillus mycoides]
MFNQMVKAVPNLFTIGNLLCGVLSIAMNMSDYLGVAPILIFFSAAGLPLTGMGFFSYSNAWITLILALLMVSPIRF